MKNKIPLWQITFPLSGVLIFGIGAVINIYMINGRYQFRLEATSQGIKIITDVDKREKILTGNIDNKEEKIDKTTKILINK